MLAVELEGCQSSTTRTTAPNTLEILNSNARIRKLRFTPDDEECAARIVCRLPDVDHAACANLLPRLESMVIEHCISDTMLIDF